MDNDFTGQDLRNQSFRGQQLKGALFRSADLRGTDFSGADLSGADLSNARTGMGRDWAIMVGLLALTSSLLLGVVAGLGGAWLRRLIHDPEPRLRAIGIFLTVELALFLIAFAWKGLSFAMRRVLPVAIAIAMVAGAAAVLTGAGSGKGALTVLAFSALLVAVMGLATLARASAGTVHMVLFMVVAVSGGLIGGYYGGGPYAIVIALSAMLAGRRALSGHAFPVIAGLATNIACAGGTRFRRADLSNATFSAAQLRNSDFRGARIDSTSFDAAQIKLCAFDRETRMQHGA